MNTNADSTSLPRNRKPWIFAGLVVFGLLAAYQLRGATQTRKHQEGKAIVERYLKDHQVALGGQSVTRSERIRILDGLAKGEYPGLFGPTSQYVRTPEQKDAVFRYLMSELGSEGYPRQFPSDDQDIQEATLNNQVPPPPKAAPSPLSLEQAKALVANNYNTIFTHLYATSSPESKTTKLPAMKAEEFQMTRQDPIYWYVSYEQEAGLWLEARVEKAHGTVEWITVALTAE